MTAHNVIPFTRPPHIADARAELVKHARAILRRPDRHSHEDVLTACYYAKQFGDEDDKALAKRARQDAAETSADVARRFAHRWPAVLAGSVAFVGFWWVVLAGVLA